MTFLGGSAPSNLQCFLDRTTPVVPSRYLPKSCLEELNQLWHPWDSDTVEYFALKDLWDCYDEWSAYGAGTPVSLNGYEALVQYYVPYLSAIQIYTSASSLTNIRGRKKERETGVPEMREFSDSCSDDSESDKLWRSSCSSSEDCDFDQDSLWHLRDRLGYLYFQYIERSAPYGRVPLKVKISELAQEFPGLLTLRSVDLSPASWMAVAWYPIYHIPVGRTVKDLSACFLTYHTLSSSFQEAGPHEDMDCAERKQRERKGMALPPFGLATYKMQGSVWVSGADGRDHDRLLSLFSAADSWLKQLGVQHHDFNYFRGIRRG
ncbi:uncharacterized protein LOC103713936 [Phoenix dactylifera]|uniref:Uncharacterized protein LOC103713936 n=1 Tax=Phoenix dactylifera TaxID=42345 RepID=A0A8B7CHA9_PHODC|nr:uncharacterized protein LOC103713936 [Phoenix dactylifera]